MVDLLRIAPFRIQRFKSNERLLERATDEDSTVVLCSTIYSAEAQLFLPRSFSTSAVKLLSLNESV